MQVKRETMKEYYCPKIVNVVTLWDLRRKTVIKGDSGKTKKRFNADVIKEGKKSLLVFASGKVIATGFTKIKDAKKYVQNVFPDDKIKFVKVVNMTASGKIKSKIDIMAFVASGLNVSYEPEIYPAIYWRSENICVTYYPKGSYIITGVRNRRQLRETFNKFWAHFKIYIKERR